MLLNSKVRHLTVIFRSVKKLDYLGKIQYIVLPTGYINVEYVMVLSDYCRDNKKLRVRYVEYCRVFKVVPYR